MMGMNIRGFFRKTDGAAAVEFSFIAPVVLFLMLGTIDFGIYIKERMKMEQIARASVEYVLQGGYEENIHTDVVSYYDGSGQYEISTNRMCTCSDGVMVSCGEEMCPTGDYSRQFVQVDLVRTFTPLFSYPGIPASLTLRGSARLRYD
jgi:Flp pilus assembly protein TadG